jgi:hypothetical protein
MAGNYPPKFFPGLAPKEPQERYPSYPPRTGPAVVPEQWRPEPCTKGSSGYAQLASHAGADHRQVAGGGGVGQRGDGGVGVQLVRDGACCTDA